MNLLLSAKTRTRHDEPVPGQWLTGIGDRGDHGEGPVDGERVAPVSSRRVPLLSRSGLRRRVLRCGRPAIYDRRRARTRLAKASVRRSADLLLLWRVRGVDAIRRGFRRGTPPGGSPPG